jgi:ubiquinone/menaquinone biosynthesis C-methylase UbiE
MDNSASSTQPIDLNPGSTVKVMGMASTSSPSAVPNHHGDHPGFAGIAGLLAGLSMLPGRRSVARLAVELTRTGPADRVVDVGCGPGSAVRAAARMGATVYGVDPAPVMLTLARAITLRGRGISWLEGTAEEVPLPDDSVTVLWSIATVHHWRDIDSGLSEALRVLEPGGRVLALERRSRPGARGLASHGWTADQADAFAERCRTSGFANVRVEEHRTRLSTQLAVLAARPPVEG